MSARVPASSSASVSRAKSAPTLAYGRRLTGTPAVGGAPQTAAMTTISTRSLALASRASTVARPGVLPGTTHASHTAFISSKPRMSAR